MNRTQLLPLVLNGLLIFSANSVEARFLEDHPHLISDRDNCYSGSVLSPQGWQSYPVAKSNIPPGLTCHWEIDRNAWVGFDQGHDGTLRWSGPNETLSLDVPISWEADFERAIFEAHWTPEE